MEQIKTRDHRIDTVKFLLIFGIYVFHCGNAAGRLYPFFSTYHVPAFFMVSGFWAMRKDPLPPGRFLSDAWRRYLSPWALWILIYTVYHSVRDSLGVQSTFDLLIKYGSAVRGTGIGGMWFVAGFFLVALGYRLITSLTGLLRPRSRARWAVWNLASALIIWLCFRQSPWSGAGWLFSLDFVPEYLFYYALGAVGYGLLERFRQWSLGKERSARYITGALYALAALWMMLVYFQKTDLLLSRVPGGVPDPIPEVLTVVLALIGNYALASLCSGKWTAALGQSTLILCCSEAMSKNLIRETLRMLGLSPTLQNPVQAVLFSLLALAAGWYIAVPLTSRVMGAVRRKGAEGK